MSLQKFKNLKKGDTGFTIIEVLIVLAIAGLILLIVFLAVPALQRSQRNSARKSDAGHLSTAINDYFSNNNGTLPLATAAGWPTACGPIMQNAGTLSQFVNTTGAASNTAPGTGVACDTAPVAFAVGGNVMKPGIFSVEVMTAAYTAGKGITSAAAAGNGNIQELMLVESGTCTGATGGGTTHIDPAFGNTTQAALIYSQESGNGNPTLACLTVE